MHKNFTLPRQAIGQELIEFGCLQLKKQKERVPAATKKNLQTLAAVLRKIKNEGLPSCFIIKKLPRKLGHGLFLKCRAKPIYRGETIAPYSGKVFIAPQSEGDGSDYAFALIADLHLSKEEQKTWDPKRRFSPKRRYSIDLDAEKVGNFTRFINHSEHPNVEARLVRIPSNSLGLEPSPFELLYIAKKTIHPGEQLLVCYEGDDKSYWGALGIKPFEMDARTFLLSDEPMNLVSKEVQLQNNS